MKYQAAEYLPGDRIYIFSHLRHKQGSGTFEIARVVRVTPTGQLVAKVAESGLERRFNPEGQEFGDWGIWTGSSWITDKDSALERALQIRRESAERKLRKDVQTELASLAFGTWREYLSGDSDGYALIRAADLDLILAFVEERA